MTLILLATAAAIIGICYVNMTEWGIYCIFLITLKHQALNQNWLLFKEMGYIQ